MKTYFIDTSYWLGRSDPSDQLHSRAVEVGREIGKDIRLITTELVLVEWLDSTSRFGKVARQEVAHQILRMDDTDDVRIIPQNEYMFRSGLMDFGRFAY